jgi:hypothetical protein
MQVIHYELPNDPETFVHRSGCTGRAGKEGTTILMHTSNQKRTVKSLERDVGCRFEFISPPSIEEVLESLFLRRCLGVQASQGPGRPGRLANPRLIRFSLYFSHFLSFFTDMVSACLALYSPRRLEGG